MILVGSAVTVMLSIVESFQDLQAPRKGHQHIPEKNIWLGRLVTGKVWCLLRTFHCAIELTPNRVIVLPPKDMLLQYSPRHTMDETTNAESQRSHWDKSDGVDAVPKGLDTLSHGLGGSGRECSSIGDSVRLKACITPTVGSP